MRLHRFALTGLYLAVAVALRAEEIWRIDNVANIGGHRVSAMGSPKVINVDQGAALHFDGAQDGVLVPGHPLAGAKAFTIEVLFSPDVAGNEAQRFFHLQDSDGRRALLELRTDGKVWWLDAFLRTKLAPAHRGLALIDPTRVHPAGRWYWIAMRYDGEQLADFVNGRKELEGEVPSTPFGDGKVSLGVRQNLVSWFKGSIREVRFHREALPEDRLQRVE